MKTTLKQILLTTTAVTAGLWANSRAHALTGDQFDYGTYFRTGAGMNNKGGSQSCFTNPFVNGDHNDFRLGNECGTYSELKLRGISTKGKDASDPYFAAETMFSFGTPNAKNEEATNTKLRELYIEGGNLFGTKQTYWIGKRYYRDIDAHMDDFFYYGQVTSNGAGVTHVDTGWGNFAAAWFIESPTDPVTGAAVTANTQAHMLDLRLSDAPLTDTQTLNLWVGASTAKGDNNAGYGKYSGALLGARHHIKLDAGTNDLALMYGYGLLSRFNTEGTANHMVGDPIGSAGALRVVDHFTNQWDGTWAMHAIGIFESRKAYFAKDKNGIYWSVGVRPVYFFTDHFHLAVELGHDEGKDDGAGGKNMMLTRFTIAPELVAARDIWSRPSLRLFYTTSFWNKNAQGLIGGSQYVANTSGSNVGVQGEIWF